MTRFAAWDASFAHENWSEPLELAFLARRALPEEQRAAQQPEEPAGP